ncbi:MAG: hypothetical protein J5616_04320 [Bacteroidaceae bacterium]|nr:hypothetical protein [Bacteroidaceae bacterium]
METNNNQFLPQYTLDQLSERVCARLSYFGNYKTWERIPELCMRIEAEPRAVDSVIIETKSTYSSSVAQNIYKYHLILTRVYMLLYYRHRDDRVYQAVVFPELTKNMNGYAGETLKAIIHPEIDRIIELDQLVSKAKADEKKNVKPVFAYVSHSRPEMDRLYIEYSEERLFHEMVPVIRELSTTYSTHLDEANVWYNAKQIVHTLKDINHPEYFIERAATSLVQGQLYEGYKGSQIILLCVYMMVRSAKDNPHFAKFVNAMEELEYDGGTDLGVIQTNIGLIKNEIDNHNPFDGYDYIGEQPRQDTFTRADMERYVSDYKAKLEAIKTDMAQKDKEIEELNRRIGSLKQESKYSDEDVEEMKSELEDFRQHTKGLNPRQTAILGYKLADHLKALPTDKQKLALPLSKISGWGKRSLEQKICGYFNEEEEMEIANIFGEEFPEIAKIISKKWRSTRMP